MIASSTPCHRRGIAPAILVLLLLSLGLFALPGRIQAQDIEECADPEEPIDSIGLTEDEIEVADDIIIADAKLILDISHPSPSDLTVYLYTPSGTALLLYDEFPTTGSDLMVTFSDDGSDLIDADTDCECEVVGEWGFGNIAGEGSEGTWTISIADDDSDDDGTLSTWCLQLYGPCPTVPPTDISCEADGDDVELEWTNDETYGFISVVRNGELLEDLDGDDTTYTDENVPPGRHVYELVVPDKDDECFARDACSVAVNAEVDCVTGPTALSSSSSVLSLNLVSLDSEPTLLEIAIDITHPKISDLSMLITSPGGTSITLHSEDGRNEAGLHVRYLDDTIDHGDAPFDCHCRMEPADGEVADLLDDPEGFWTLSIEDAFSLASGTFDSWCMWFYTEETPMEFIRGDVNGNGEFSGLTDGLFLLRWAFVSGSDAPLCDEAADADNNGDVSGLLDALYILRAAFETGSPEPDAPYPDCGLLDDDDESDLGCDEGPEDCN